MCQKKEIVVGESDVEADNAIELEENIRRITDERKDFDDNEALSNNDCLLQTKVDYIPDTISDDNYNDEFIYTKPQ